MGLMNSALQIGRTALLSYQSALQTVGNNISSAGSPDYTRLSPQLDPLQGPVIAGEIQPGAGVALTGIQRNIDEALEGRIRLAIGAQESGSTQQTSLAQVEAFLDDINGTGVEARLRDFFHGFDDLQNRPEDLATRDLTIANGRLLAESLQTLRAQFSALGADADGQIADIVASANEIARQIGEINEQITTAESSSPTPATGLRDQRDALLRELSEMFDVTVRQQANGAVNVYIGSEALVQAGFVRTLTAVEETDGEFIRTSVRFADNNGQVNIRGGRLEGLIIARDQHGYGQVALVDTLANAVITDVNRIHADGQGLVGYTTLTSAYDLLASDQPLDAGAAGLPFAAYSGSFYITVTDDATGTPLAYRIEVELPGDGTGATLESLAADIDAQVEGVGASVSAGHRLTLTAVDGFTFTFGHDGQVAREDTSGVLAALGLNTFFSGTDARSIAVNDSLVQQPGLLAAASTFHAGDGTNAGRIAALETEACDSLGGTTISDFYNSIAGALTVASSSARDESEAVSSVLSSLQAQKESISGVNLDEEAISLVKYERAFQGVSRFVSVVNDLLRELVTLIR
jgi:flagellar hook-associated protein 1 FlgK